MSKMLSKSRPAKMLSSMKELSEMSFNINSCTSIYQATDWTRRLLAWTDFLKAHLRGDKFREGVRCTGSNGRLCAFVFPW